MKKFNVLVYIVFLGLFLSVPGKTLTQPQHFHTCWEGQQPFSPMNIYIIGAKLNGQDLTVNDEIGIFDGELCVGVGVVTGTLTSTSFLEIIASKDDGLSGLGFKDGNKISLKIWIKAEDKELPVDDSVVQFHDPQTSNPIAPAPFAGLGTAVISFDGKANGQKHFHPCWEGQQPFSPMNIYVIGAKLDGLDLKLDDEIGIFDGDLCVGAGVVTGKLSSTNFLEIIVSKDDGISGLGFKDGNEILVKIWIKDELKEFSIDSNDLKFHDPQTGNPINPIPFAGLGTAVVTIDGKRVTDLFYYVKKIPANLALPTIDGFTNESIWSLIKEDTLQHGGVPFVWNSQWTDWTNNFVTWKAAWSSVTNKLYLAVTIKDDIRGIFDNNNPADPLFQPWNDECIEIFTDGNNDGGFYEGSYDKAQQWFITGENKIVLDDYPSSAQYTLYTGPDLISAVSMGSAGEWICEAEINIYDIFPASRRTLMVGDTIGWNIWYDDTDNQNQQGGKYVRDNQVGWQYTGPADTNANHFGKIVLDPDLAYILVNSPDGGEYWKVGTSQTISWTSYKVSGNVKIEISTDTGTSWTTIASSTMNSGSYSWSPNAQFISNHCLVKITSLSDATIFDQSDATFIISDKEKVDLWIDTNLTGTEGDTVRIPVHCSDVTGLSVISASLAISCDGNVLEFIGADISGTMLEAAGWGPPTHNISFGKIRLGMAATASLSGSGVLVKIVGKIMGKQGDSTALQFNSAFFNEGDPVVLTEDGLLKVKSGYDLKGQLGYYKNPAVAVPNASVLLTGAAIKLTATDENGNYEFLNLGSGDYIVTASKTNEDKGAITPFDASMILRYDVGTQNLSPYQKIAGDVSGNGDVTSFDASWILRYSVGIVTSFPVGADWTFVPHDFPIDDSNWSTSPRSRAYSPLNSPQLDQNFMSVLYGDVSGNWSSTGGTGASVTADIQIGDVEQTGEETWQIPIDMQFLDEVYSGSFKLVFNKDNLQFESASIVNTTSNIISEASNSDEGANFAFASGESLHNWGLKIKLLFKGLTPNIPSPSQIGIENLIFDDNPGIISSIDHNPGSEIPTEWSLVQNRPNPFNAETVINYQVPEAAHVKIEIFNLLGQRLKILVDQVYNPGTYNVIWNGKDGMGSAVGSGIYVYRMRTKTFTSIKKMVLVQ